jgi:hypothetical protein
MPPSTPSSSAAAAKKPCAPAATSASSTKPATPRRTGGSALLEDFFTEEYALNHLIHFYPKPYIALMDGVVMGGGMGIAQGGPGLRPAHRHRAHEDGDARSEHRPVPGCRRQPFPVACAGALGDYLGLTGADHRRGRRAVCRTGRRVRAGRSDGSAARARRDDAGRRSWPEAIRDFAAPFAEQAGASELDSTACADRQRTSAPRRWAK